MRIVGESRDLDVLATDPGHYLATAWLGQPDAIAAEAHGVCWMRFDELRPGESLLANTRNGNFSYSLTGSRLAISDDSALLQPRPGHESTMSSCCPLQVSQFAGRRRVIFTSRA